MLLDFDIGFLHLNKNKNLGVGFKKANMAEMVITFFG